MPTIAEKRSAFRRLHERGCFVIPNPWDIGTARYLQHLHFKALATTSAGAAFSLGRPDNETVTRDDMLAHIKMIVDASDLPVNADYESGYAHEPAKVAENVRLCVETGVAGLSIEDNSGDRANPLYRSRSGGRPHPRRPRRDRPSRAPTCCSPAAPSAFSSAGRTCRKRSSGSSPMRRPAPTVSMRRASAAAKKSRPWCWRWRQSR